MTKNLLITIIVLLFVLTSAQPTYAVDSSINFGSCVNPQWELSQANKGNNHGVVNVDSFAGTDKIYKSGDNVLQCLCTDSGQGYETKWLKTEGLSQSQINQYTSEGWISVENGSEWGLANTPYLARNSKYACTSGVGGTASNAATASTANASSTNVLGFASTGNTAFIYLLIAMGSAALITGFVMARKKTIH